MHWAAVAKAQAKQLLILVFAGLRWVRQARLCAHRGTSTCSGIESGTVTCPTFWVRTPFLIRIGPPDSGVFYGLFQDEQANRAC